MSPWSSRRSWGIGSASPMSCATTPEPRLSRGRCTGVSVGVGDEVICQSLTYWGSVLQVFSLGSHRRLRRDRSADSDHRSGRYRTPDHSSRTRAIVAVHLSSYPSDMDAIMEIAGRHGLKVIEDVSHAQGGRAQGQAARNHRRRRGDVHHVRKVPGFRRGRIPGHRSGEDLQPRPRLRALRAFPHPLGSGAGSVRRVPPRRLQAPDSPALLRSRARSAAPVPGAAGGDPQGDVPLLGPAGGGPGAAPAFAPGGQWQRHGRLLLSPGTVPGR